MLERIGSVAYRLQLPASARLHGVFHVGLLKPYKGAPPTTSPALPPLLDSRLLPVPDRALHTQLRRGVWYILIQWHGLPAEEATWEQLQEFQNLYPAFQLEDELFVKGGEML